MNTRKFATALITAALAFGSAAALAQAAPGGAYGPGMMHGYGGGYGPMHGGYGPGYGMGPGMMDGYGAGYGMGPGMMYGGGAPCWGGGSDVNLTDEQRGKIVQIQQDLQRKQWDLMTKMRQAYGDGYGGQDETEAKKRYRNVAQLREQMFDNMLAARKEMDKVIAQSQGSQSQGK